MRLYFYTSLLGYLILWSGASDRNLIWLERSVVRGYGVWFCILSRALSRATLSEPPQNLSKFQSQIVAVIQEIIEFGAQRMLGKQRIFLRTKSSAHKTNFLTKIHSLNKLKIQECCCPDTKRNIELYCYFEVKLWSFCWKRWTLKYRLERIFHCKLPCHLTLEGPCIIFCNICTFQRDTHCSCTG